MSLPQILPLAAPSTQRTRLISTEDLTSSVIRRQNTEDARMQLLHVDPRAESTRMAFSTNSSKRQWDILILVFLDSYFYKQMNFFTILTGCFCRQKRREEKAVQGRKPEVSFRPNESIIPAQEVESLSFCKGNVWYCCSTDVTSPSLVCANIISSANR